MEAKQTTWKSFGQELLWIVLISVTVSLLMNYVVHPALNLGDNLPMPARTLSIWIVISILIKKKGQKWSDFGLSKPKKRLRTVLTFLGLMAFLLVLSGIITGLLTNLFNTAPVDYSSFAFIQGNTWALIYFLILSWGIGGFVEEMVFRGYLFVRLQELIGNKRGGLIASILLQSIVFGVIHWYQGHTGMIATGVNALGFSIAWYVSGKNLWAGIIAHALLDTAGMIVIYYNGVSAL